MIIIFSYILSQFWGRYEVDKNVLIVNKHRVEFQYNIQNVISIGKKLVVLLDVPFDITLLDNVFAVSYEGEIIWRIQNPSEVYPISDRLPYEYMRLDDLSNLVVTDFVGIRYTVNPVNGTIIGRDCVK